MTRIHTYTVEPHGTLYIIVRNVIDAQTGVRHKERASVQAYPSRIYAETMMMTRSYPKYAPGKGVPIQ